MICFEGIGKIHTQQIKIELLNEKNLQFCNYWKEPGDENKKMFIAINK